MPKIEYTHILEINVERFLNACSAAELFDVDRLIQRPRYRDKITQMLGGIQDEHADAVEVKPAELADISSAIPTHVYRCPVCKTARRGPTGYFGACTYCETSDLNHLQSQPNFIAKEEVQPFKKELAGYFPDNSVAITTTREGVVGYRVKLKKLTDQDRDFLDQFCRKNACQFAAEPVRGGIEANIFR